MSVFHVQRRVEFCETDMAGIVHFSNFFRYMEFAEVSFLRSLGLSVKLDAEGLDVGFPRVAATCEYLKPARFEDVLDIAVRVERLGTKSVTYAMEFTRDGEVLARGRMTSVCCQIGEDRPLRAMEIPPVYREGVERFVG